MKYAGIAAIALTLIIAVPIVLGYGLASDEQSYTKTSTSDVTSITDALLNNSSDYFVDYSKSNNNSGMLQRITSQGDNYYTYKAPDYVSTDVNYSSIPVYTTTSQTSTLSGTVLHTVTEAIATSTPENPAAVIGYGLGDSPADYWSKCGEIDIVYGHHNYYTQYVHIESSSTPIMIFIDGVTNTNYYPYEDEANAITTADSITSAWDPETDTYTFTVGNTEYTGKWAYICCYRNGTGLWNEYDHETIAPTDNGTAVDDWTFTTDYASVVKLTHFDDTVEYKVGTTVSHTANYTMVDDDVVNEVKSVGISHISSVLEYYTRTITGYADPAYGWYNAEAPDLVNPVYYNAWYNTYQNAKIIMYAHFEGNGYVEFYQGFTDNSPIVMVKRVSGEISVIANDLTVHTLGDYEYVQLIFDTTEDKVTVNGLSSMPSMGAAPNTLNSVTTDFEYDGYIELLKIVDQFTTILPVTADYYTENNESVSITFDRWRPQYSFILADSDGNWVSSGWTATLSTEDYRTATFTPTSLSDGVYTLYIYGPQFGSENTTIYVGDISSVSTSPISYRVDTATIVAGDYPSTVDYTFDIWTLFPNDNVQKIHINSIGVYGDYIKLGARNYNVTNGTIDITDMDTGKDYTVKLLKSTITIELDDGHYTISVNGIPVVNTNNQSYSTITFGGEWSLTATRSTVVEETAVKSVWTPGEFALDTDGFVLAMVLTATAVFVVLGLTGVRSGAKVGLLALICGGACAVGLMII